MLDDFINKPISLQVEKCVSSGAVRYYFDVTIFTEQRGSILINKNNSPVEWAGLMYELEDAHETPWSINIGNDERSEFDETDFRISLAHVFHT